MVAGWSQYILNKTTNAFKSRIISSEDNISFVKYEIMNSWYGCNTPRGLHLNDYDTWKIGEDFVIALNKLYWSYRENKNLKILLVFEEEKR